MPEQHRFSPTNPAPGHQAAAADGGLLPLSDPSFSDEHLRELQMQHWLGICFGALCHIIGALIPAVRWYWAIPHYGLMVFGFIMGLTQLFLLNGVRQELRVRQRRLEVDPE